MSFETISFYENQWQWCYIREGESGGIGLPRGVGVKWWENRRERKYWIDIHITWGKVGRTENPLLL